MNEICRLCLNKEASSNMCKITKNCRLAQILHRCFLLELTLDNDLPEQVCDTCTFKINDFVSFREKVIENEKVLLLEAARLKRHQDKTNEICDVAVTDNERINNVADKSHSENNINDTKTSSDFQINIEINNQMKDLQPNLCLMCFESFSSRNKLFKHYLDKKRDVKLEVVNVSLVNIKTDQYLENTVSYVCKICGKHFNDAYGILNHGKSHSINKFSCSFKCGYSSGYMHVLKNHEKTHTKQYKYVCMDCGKGFNVKTWFEQHQNIHKGIKNYKCNVCGASFHMDRYLTSHKISLHPEVYTKKRFVCMYCSLEFALKGKFNLHLQEHGIKNEFLCDQCGKVMKDKKQLTAHKLQHSTNRPFACRKCDKTFAKKYNWKIHLRTHRNELSERFECNICQKTFTQQSALNRHKRSKHKQQQVSDVPKAED